MGNKHMHLTRLGFNLFVVAYLAPLVFMDIAGNTLSTGAASDFFYYKSMFDGVLIAYALYEAFAKGATASVSAAKARVADAQDDVVNFGQIHSIEWSYCLLLSVYAAVNWYFLHGINKESTGFISIATLVWSFVSLAVCILAAMQFYNLKSGKIVELRKQILQ